MLACAFVAVFAVFTAVDAVHSCAIVLAGAFGVYAICQDRHLRRLATLQSDAHRISLVVAGELIYSGALYSDCELLDLREAVARGAGALAKALAEVLPCASRRVRLVGPSGEMPVAAEAGRRFPDDPSLATGAIRALAPVRRAVGHHTLLVVPMWRGVDAVGVLEALSPPGEHYQPGDAALVDAFARGAVAAMNSLPSAWSSKGVTR
jgi:hypothetical protein